MATCKQCGAVIHSYTYSGEFCTHDCAMLHDGYKFIGGPQGGRWTRITDDDIRLFSISVSCDQIGAMICWIALGDKADGVIAHLTPGAARALVELEIERLRAQGSL